MFKKKRGNPSKSKFNLESSDQDLLNRIDKEKDFEVIETLIDHIKDKYNLSLNDVLDILFKKLKKLPSDEEMEGQIPVSIFQNNKLSCLEAIVKYLKENLDLKYNKIASLINRDQRTIWATYNNSKKKLSKKFVVKDIKYHIPIQIFKDRKFSVLELISKYLHEDQELSYHEIAMLINRDDRTVWTVYQRYLKKRRKNV